MEAGSGGAWEGVHPCWLSSGHQAKHHQAGSHQCAGERGTGAPPVPASAQLSVLAQQSSPGLQRRDTRDQAHRIPRQGGRVAHTSHLPKKIKSKTPRHQLSITPPTPKERLRAGNSLVGIVFATQAGDPGYSPALRNKAGHSGTHPKPSAGR